MAYSNDYKRTISGRAVSLMGNARRRCKAKGIELNITQAWVEKHLIRGTCEITGLHFCFEPRDQNTTRRWDAPSLDRKDKDLPYTEDNTRVILWAVNCALAEYGTKTMLPILKAMVKGIESAQKIAATSVSTGTHHQGDTGQEHGAIPTAGTREDYYDLDHYQRTVRGEDADYSAKKSGGDSMGCRGEKMATLVALERIESNGEPDTETVRLDFKGRYLLD